MMIGVDLAGLLGGRMASAEGGSLPSGVGYGEGCPLSIRLRDLGSVVSSPSGVRGRAPAENGFWRNLKATERSFLYLHRVRKKGATLFLPVTLRNANRFSKFFHHHTLQKFAVKSQ